MFHPWAFCILGWVSCIPETREFHVGKKSFDENPKGEDESRSGHWIRTLSWKTFIPVPTNYICIYNLYQEMFALILGGELIQCWICAFLGATFRDLDGWISMTNQKVIWFSQANAVYAKNISVIIYVNNIAIWQFKYLSQIPCIVMFMTYITYIGNFIVIFSQIAIYIYRYVYRLI